MGDWFPHMLLVFLFFRNLPGMERAVQVIRIWGEFVNRPFGLPPFHHGVKKDKGKVWAVCAGSGQERS